MRQMRWARLAPVRAVRGCVQVVGVKPVVRKELSVEVYGLDELRQLDGPALIMANHASHLDTAVLLSTLPTKRRRHTAVGIEADYFFDSWWRASGSAIVFNTFPIDRNGDVLKSTLATLLAKGWTVVVFPRRVRRPIPDGRSGGGNRFSGAGHSGWDPRHLRGNATWKPLAGPRASAGGRPVWVADHSTAQRVVGRVRVPGLGRRQEAARRGRCHLVEGPAGLGGSR